MKQDRLLSYEHSVSMPIWKRIRALRGKVNCTSQPIALAVPTHEKMKQDRLLGYEHSLSAWNGRIPTAFSMAVCLFRFHPYPKRFSCERSSPTFDQTHQRHVALAPLTPCGVPFPPPEMVGGYARYGSQGIHLPALSRLATGNPVSSQCGFPVRIR